MWSNGNTPFSGGTGRDPLFPPNAPPKTNWNGLSCQWLKDTYIVCQSREKLKLEKVQ